MKSTTAQKIRASTQKFTEIENIKEDIVLLSGGNACLVIEVQATNFTLLSQEEQHAKIFAYAALLNSLSFPIQIVIRNKRVDISSYLKLIDTQMQKTPDEKRHAYIKHYQAFVEELIKVNTVLNKMFYIVVSYSFLEKGVGGVGMKKEEFFAAAKASLHTKTESLVNQLARIGLRSRVLDTNGLIQLFYDIYNQESTVPIGMQQVISAPMVHGQNKQ